MERQPTTDRMIQEYVPGKQVTRAPDCQSGERFI